MQIILFRIFISGTQYFEYFWFIAEVTCSDQVGVELLRGILVHLQIDVVFVHQVVHLAGAQLAEESLDLGLRGHGREPELAGLDVEVLEAHILSQAGIVLLEVVVQLQHELREQL